MKASKLIEQLQAAIDKLGDVEVVVDGYYAEEPGGFSVVGLAERPRPYKKRHIQVGVDRFTAKPIIKTVTVADWSKSGVVTLFPRVHCMLSDHDTFRLVGDDEWRSEQEILKRLDPQDS